MELPGRWKKIIILIFLVVLILISSLYYNQVSKSDYYEVTTYFMNTVVQIKVEYRSEVKAELNQIINILKNQAEQFDRYQAFSLVSKINQAEGKKVEINKSLAEIILTTKQYYYLLNGSFDITIAPLLDLWGFGKDSRNTVPSQAEIRSVLELVNFEQVEITKENKKYFLKLAPGQKIDLGGIAKGFIVDQAVQLLEEAGYQHVFVNAGGNIKVSGKKIDGTSWQIGIRLPKGEQPLTSQPVLKLTRGAVATSGDYERYFEVDGKKYSHLINPKTGYPADELRSVTVYAEQALIADLLSTALFMLEPARAIEIVSKIEGVEVFIIGKDRFWKSNKFDYFSAKKRE